MAGWLAGCGGGECVSHVQSAAQLSVVPHLDVDPLIQTQPDQIQRLFYSVGGLLLQIKFQYYKLMK